MYLNDRQLERVLHWLVQLSLGLFRPDLFAGVAALSEEIKKVSLPQENESVKELHRLFRREEETMPK